MPARKIPYGKEFAAIYDRDWASWSALSWPDLRRFVKRRNAKARTWLDLCCGTGRLLGLASRSDFEVTGVDQSPHQLFHARRNARKARLYRMDVRKLRVRGRFDVVTCMYDSPNYILKARELGRFFVKVRELLADRGLFMFDVNTIESHEAYWNRSGVWHKPGRVLAQKSSFDPVKRIARVHITGFLKKGALYRRFDELHVERSYPRRELEGLLAKAGFRFRSFDRTPGKPRPARKCRHGLLYVCVPKGK